MLKAIDKKNESPSSYKIPECIEFWHLQHKIIMTKNHFEAALIDTHTRIEIQSRKEDDVSFYLKDEILSNFYTAKVPINRGVLSKDKIKFTTTGALDLQETNFYKKLFPVSIYWVLT
ncbi:MAG: hypothetical protein ACMZI0_05420 [Symbiopectobacterium sp.]|uniref:hypothetical protein n=1 Tax=Symbiopectobacterium sp. TaxID=2952789 RepID=UPI0039E7A72D